LTIYNSGNINLRCPFLNVKGKGRNETMLPIHCAAQGGSLLLFKWLIDIHYCPIKMIRTGNKSKAKVDDQIRTSKGRTVLEIAMSRQHSDIVRYLVNEKNLSIYGIKDIQTSLFALEGILKTFPTQQKSRTEKMITCSYIEDENHSPDPDSNNIDNLSREYKSNNGVHKKKQSSLYMLKQIPKFQVSGLYDDDDDDESSGTQNNVNMGMEPDEEVSIATTVNDDCIICYERTIDCVITPCGHQVCCLKCSEKISKCPLCHSDCQILKIFKP